MVFHVASFGDAFGHYRLNVTRGMKNIWVLFMRGNQSRQNSGNGIALKIVLVTSITALDRNGRYIQTRRTPVRKVENPLALVTNIKQRKIYKHDDTQAFQ